MSDYSAQNRLLLREIRRNLESDAREKPGGCIAGKEENRFHEFADGEVLARKERFRISSGSCWKVESNSFSEIYRSTYFSMVNHLVRLICLLFGTQPLT